MEKLKAAIDIGTTTVAVCLITENGEIRAKDGFLNGQSRYGSDVISRITNSVKGNNLSEMKKLILSDIENCLKKLVITVFGDDFKDDLSNYISEIYITANTTMASIVAGYEIRSLGTYPFTIPFTDIKEIEILGVTAYVFPGASAFIGADVLAGAVYLNLCEGDILIDLGTNGEMILMNDKKYHAASAACGPAFENCTRAKNIFGATTLNALSYLIKTGKISADGSFNCTYETDEKCGNYINHGDFKITDNIVRSVQLAVSALYTTLTLLMKDAGLTLDNVKHFYIAGGFGFHMSLSDAVTLGLIPEKLMQKSVISNNTSLEGACCIALDKKRLEEFNEIKHNVLVHQYGGDERYNESFIKNLYFKKR